MVLVVALVGLIVVAEIREQLSVKHHPVVRGLESFNPRRLPPR